MRHPKHQVTSEEDLFVGIGLHKSRWHVTIRTFDVELFSASIPGTWEALHRVLFRYPCHPLQAVYESGYFGFRLHDHLVDHGIEPYSSCPECLTDHERDPFVPMPAPVPSVPAPCPQGLFPGHKVSGHCMPQDRKTTISPQTPCIESP